MKKLISVFILVIMVLSAFTVIFSIYYGKSAYFKREAYYWNLANMHENDIARVNYYINDKVN